MAEHDPQDLEWESEHLAAALGYSPEKHDALLKAAAARGLDHLAKTGAKVTTRDTSKTADPKSLLHYVWREYHLAAPLTPRDET